MNVENIPHNTVSPTEHYYRFEECNAPKHVGILFFDGL